MNKCKCKYLIYIYIYIYKEDLLIVFIINKFNYLLNMGHFYCIAVLIRPIKYDKTWN